LRRILFLVIGWVCLVGGFLLCFVPLPIPLIGIVPFLIGAAILSQYSKPFRRAFQYLRHRFEWFSQTIERVAHRTPEMVRHMVHRTNPIAHVRLARKKARRKHHDVHSL
jgi:uncharacterized membrane protein YbaN (DUF454 family)